MIGTGIAAAVLLAWPAQATYSIVAADAGTRQVGGAVTSCVAPQSVQIVYRSAPGHGAIHAQAAANSAGRDRGVALLEAGTAPADVIAQITMSSFDTRFQTRQYGVVDLSGRAAGFTGSSAQPYREDRQGSLGSYVYSVQGNILTSARVLDQTEAGFKAKGCDLAERLMLALEAGAENGEGDSRCTTRGVPSDSASLDVDREGEPAGSYLRLSFTSGSAARENPLLRLRAEFDTWRRTHPCPAGAGSGGAGGASGGTAGVSGGGSGGLGASGGSSSGGLSASGGSGSGGLGASGRSSSGGLSATGGATSAGGATSGGAPVSSGGVAGALAGTAGSAQTPGTDSGCGCRVQRRSQSGLPFVASAIACIWLSRRRRTRRVRVCETPGCL